MDPVGLTKQSAKTLSFVQNFIEAHGWSPSFQEIMDSLGWKSKGNVARNIRLLIDRGYLAKRPGANRSLVVLRRVPGSVAATAAADVPQSANMERYQQIEESLLRSYAVFSGENPGVQETMALRRLAVAMTAIPDDYAVARRLHRISGAIANCAAEIEKNARSAA